MLCVVLRVWKRRNEKDKLLSMWEVNLFRHLLFFLLRDICSPWDREMLLAMMRMIPNNDSAMMIMMMMVVVGNHRQEKRKVENSSVDSDLQCKPVSDPNEISSLRVFQKERVKLFIFSRVSSFPFVVECCILVYFTMKKGDASRLSR